MDKKYAILLGFDEGHPALTGEFMTELAAIVAAEIGSFDTKHDFTVNLMQVGDTSYRTISGHSSFHKKREGDPEKPI